MLEASNVIKTIMMLAYLGAGPQTDPHSKAFSLTSPAFKNGHAIPAAYTCHGKNLSIPIQWHNVPKNTQSLALVMIDEDTPWPGFYHWEVLDIPPTESNIKNAVHSPEFVGRNSWGAKKYQGPCPPKGKHHYVVRLYALNKKLDASAGKNPLALNRAMRNHIIAQAELTGYVTH